MFLVMYIYGWFNIIMWRLGIMVSGTAPSYYTAYSTYGWLGYHYKHRHNPRHICKCNRIFQR